MTDTPDETLPRALIIRHRDEFQQLYRQGRRRTGKFVQVIYLPFSPVDPLAVKAAFICRKPIGNAVIRNRMKRRLREVFRKNKPVFRGFRVLFVVQPPMVAASSEEITRDVLGLAEKIRQ